MEIPRSLSQASTSNHLTFILPLSDGQASEAWEPHNKITLFLLPK